MSGLGELVRRGGSDREAIISIARFALDLAERSPRNQRRVARLRQLLATFEEPGDASAR